MGDVEVDLRNMSVKTWGKNFVQNGTIICREGRQCRN